MEKIGLLGGTFDPIHNAHIQTALYFYNYLDLDKVVFIPTNIPPHKEKMSSTSSIDRIDMCKLALSKFHNFEVSDIEILRGGRSYTYETLRELKKVYSGSQLYFILGADMFITMETWKRPEEILKMAVLCVVQRNDIDNEFLISYAEKLKKLGAEVIITNFKPDNISSTKIRDNIKYNKNISDLVPAEVQHYIYKNKLYMGWFYEFKCLQGNNKGKINS